MSGLLPTRHISTPLARSPISPPLARYPISTPLARSAISTPLARSPISTPLARSPISTPLARSPISTPLARSPVHTIQVLVHVEYQRKECKCQFPRFFVSISFNIEGKDERNDQFLPKIALLSFALYVQRSKQFMLFYFRLRLISKVKADQSCEAGSYSLKIGFKEGKVQKMNLSTMVGEGACWRR